MNRAALSPQGLIGMVHVQALPGTPGNKYPIREILRRAVAEAEIFERQDFDAILLENMFDAPYLMRSVGPEIVASMSAVASAVRRAVDLPMGIQILAGANCEALAVAQASEAQFIRAEGFVFSHVADEGLMIEADAGRLLRYRKAIGAEDIRILADIKKKHSSHAITADMDIGETAHNAEFFGVDGLIVTGSCTGHVAAAEDLKAVRRATSLPLYVGSGVSVENLVELRPLADGFIVGSSIKKDGDWKKELEVSRLEELVKAKELCEA